MAFQRKKSAAIGIKAAFPGFIEPALATTIGKVPFGDRWLREIKFDGYGCRSISPTRRSWDYTGPSRARQGPSIGATGGRRHITACGF